jgi:predicted nucleic acid-binding protein
VGPLVNGLRRQATVLQELPKLDLSPDPDDNPVLATAIAGMADYLVTGDKRDLLSLGNVETVQIIAARAFADLLGLSAAD